MEAKARAEEALISQSSGKDAISHVIAAVELYMKAVQEAATPAERTRIKNKCRELMAYGESLKTAAPPPSPPVEAAMSSLTLETKPASPAPTAQPAPQAPPTTSSGTTTPVKTSGSPAPSQSRSVPGRRPPLSTRELPKREQIILLKASKLHGSVFPPWDALPADDIFTLASSANVPYEYVSWHGETCIQRS